MDISMSLSGAKIRRKRLNFLLYCIFFVHIFTGCGLQEYESEKQEEYQFFSVDSTEWNDLDFLDERLDKAEIILIGESHGIECNQKIEMKFLKYLYTNHGVRYYLCELPHSVCMKMNDFLASGNIDILDEFFIHAKGTNTYTEEIYQKWLELYEFNKSLPEADKVKVVGVECELVTEYAMEVIVELLSTEKEVPLEIADIMNQLIKKSYRCEDIEYILYEIEVNEPIYKEYVGEENLFHIRHILENIEIGYFVHEKNTDQERYMIRDQAMYKNFVKLSAFNEQGKYFGQFGLNHVYQMEERGVRGFASRLKENGYDGKIVSIPIEYKNCSRLYFDQDDKACVEDNFFVETSADIDMEIWNNLSKDKAVIYSAVEEESPYYHLKDYLQYMILIRDCEAATPLEME